MASDNAPPSAAALCLNVKAAAKVLGVSEGVLRDWIARGLLPAVKFPSTRRTGEHSRRVLVAFDDLRAFVVKHREVAGG
jgi:excisionase family DNA binding protein